MNGWHVYRHYRDANNRDDCYEIGTYRVEANARKVADDRNAGLEARLIREARQKFLDDTARVTEHNVLVDAGLRQNREPMPAPPRTEFDLSKYEDYCTVEPIEWDD